jgi:sulfur carrier protein
MELTINAEKQSHPAGLTVETLLQTLNMEPTLVAVEVNGRLVPRSRHGQTTLNDGDVLEIVSLAGGG